MDGWQTDSNEAAGIRITQHESLDERAAAARTMNATLDLDLPTLLDAMDNRAAEAFAAWPERIFIAQRGTIVYAGGPGPYEFRPAEAVERLVQLVSAPTGSR